MSIKVQLPPGCKGFDCKDGTKYTAKRAGGTIEVSDRHADAINNSQFGGDANLVSAKGSLSFGTKQGRWCAGCKKLWNSWSEKCPRCQADCDLVAE